MKVQLIDYTGAGAFDPARHAANVLVFTKQTRLEMRPGLLDEIAAWPWAKVEEELRYMARTIPSSWEFVGYTFLINGVSRAFTHQFVRTRVGSYAQQTMRVLNVNGWTYHTGPSIENDWSIDLDTGREEPGEKAAIYARTMDDIAAAYNSLIKAGAAIEDARGVLPTNIHTNIVAHFNLRTLAETARKRASSRTQGEYRDVANAMLECVREVHPWTTMFLDRDFDKAAGDLEAAIIKASEEGAISQDERTRLVKLVDELRAFS
jgi:thymidylate synthase (FAD)